LGSGWWDAIEQRFDCGPLQDKDGTDSERRSERNPQKIDACYDQAERVMNASIQISCNQKLGGRDNRRNQEKHPTKPVKT
jgi:hypothetical protein